MKILLVEDEPDTRQLLALHLAAARYTVEQATDGQVALELASQWDYDLILLDLNLPRLDGLSLCRKLRQRGRTTPILILTAKLGNEHVITGLDAGADDYVTKPFEVQSVLARVRALLRRGAVATEIPSLAWGQMQLDPALAQVTYGGEVVPLTPKEYSLLELFLRHPHRIFSRSNILDHLWTLDDSPTEGAVTNLVKDLRSRLKRSGIADTVIQTVYGLGYRLGEEPPEATSPMDTTSVDMASVKTTPQAIVAAVPSSSLGSTVEEPPDPPITAALERLAVLTQRFQDSLPGRIARLAQAIERLQAPSWDDLDRQMAEDEAHRLAGGLGTFGSPEGSAQAQRLEELLSSHHGWTADRVAQVVQTFQHLKQAIAPDGDPPSNPGRGQIEGGWPTDGPTPDETMRPTPACGLLMVHVDPPLAQRLQPYLSQRGYSVETVAHLPNLTTAPLSPQVGAILLGLDPASAPTAKLASLRAIRSHYPQLPVLVMTTQESLEERVQVARLQGSRYLVAPVTPGQVMDALEQVLPCGQPPESRVLVVDDDPVSLATIQEVLSPWGLQVFGLSDPRQFWDQLRQVKPDLLILALDTPTFSGFDLCQVVRQDPTHGNLPTLMLATHPDTVTVNQVFEAGGDDLIGKPIVGPELVTRVLSRVERSRLRQQLDQMRQQQALYWSRADHHDPLTQVASRGRFETFLTQQWDRHGQDRSPLALVMGTLDDFAAYQSAHGEDASHRVLRQVARALYHTINPNIDLVARSNDSQFSLVLPNTNLDGALRVATRIQQVVDQLHIPHGANRPYITLSLGIGGAVPTEAMTVSQLLVATQQALAEAQARGGNTLSLYPLSR